MEIWFGAVLCPSACLLYRTYSCRSTSDAALRRTRRLRWWQLAKAMARRLRVAPLFASTDKASVDVDMVQVSSPAAAVAFDTGKAATTASVSGPPHSTLGVSGEAQTTVGMPTLSPLAPAYIGPGVSR